MNESDKNYSSLTHFFSKILFLGIGLSKIMTTSKENTIISVLIGLIIGIVIIYIINKFNYNNTNKFRKTIMFISIFILFIIGLTEFVNLISSIYLMDTNRFNIIVPLIIVILYLNTKDISVIIKISVIFFMICLVIYSTILAILLPDINYLNFLPLFKISLSSTMFGAIQFALYSTVPNIIYGGLNKKIKDKTLIKHYIFSNITLIVTILFIQGILGIEIIELLKYPEYIVLKKITLLDFINNVENILSFIWIFTIFIYLSSCSKILFDMTYKAFNNKYIYPIGLIISLYFISTIFFDNINYLLFLFNNLWLICLIILIIYILINLPSLKKNN